MTLTGTDVSGYQDAAPNYDGLDFVISKATEGTTYVNPNHAAQIARAREAGKLAGHYHFAAGGTPEAEAQFFWANAGWQTGEQLALDLEAPFADTPGAAGWTVRFQTELMRLSGFAPELYVDSSHLHSLDLSGVAALGCGLWGAAYNDSGFGDTGPFAFVAIWQNSDKSSSGGDSDIFYGDAAAWHKYGTPEGVTPAPAPAPTSTVTPPPVPAPETGNTYPVIVAAGDTFSGIAEQYSVSLDAFKAANPGMNYDLIYPGQVLNMPSVGAAPAHPVTQCVVESGDTLGAIATQFGTTVDSILSKNPSITNPDLIFPGQVLNI